MNGLSYQDFMKQVNSRLDKMSEEDLRAMVVRWASEVQPGDRYQFLCKLRILQDDKPDEHSEQNILGEIAAFKERIAKGEYCDGWGWDDALQEERNWGDESWAEEIDQFFLKSRRFLLQGNSQFAEKVYKELFEILAMGEELGHLPGDPDYNNLLTVDLEEQVVLLLRTVYLNASTERRAELLYKAIQEYGYLTKGILLRDVVNAGDTILPQWDRFLPEWISFLKKQPAWHVSKLLREAVLLQGGIAYLAEFARENPAEYPAAYIDWIGELENNGHEEAVIQIAREALANIPRDYVLRSDIAMKLVRLGEKRSDKALKLEGCKHCFSANPSMGSLLNLYCTAIECGCFEDVRHETEQRATELQRKVNKMVDENWNSELREAHVPNNVLIHVGLFDGKCEKVLAMCKDKASLGWSGGVNPKPAFIAFILSILAAEKPYSSMLSRLLTDAMEDFTLNKDKEYVEQYRQIVSVLRKSLPISKDELAYYIKWSVDETGKRVDAIVSNQHRGSYDKAANLLVAMSEGLVQSGKKHEAMVLLEKYRGKYPRHRAFQSELAKLIRNRV